MQFSKGHSQTFTAGRALRLKWLLAIFGLVILTGLCTVTAHAAQPYISNVDVKNLGDVVQITVSSSSALSIHDSRLGNRYLVFDLYGRLAPGERQRVNIDGGGIRSIRCGWFHDAPAIARIAVGTKGVRNYSISAARGQRVTTIKIRKQGAAPVPARTGASVKSEKPVPGGAERPVVVAANPPAAVAQAKPAKLVSLDFASSDIQDVLKALALQGGINVVAGPDVKGSVTVSLNRVTVDEALKLVVNMSGFKYQLIEGSYVVGTDANIRAMRSSSADPEDMATEVVTISYADPATVTKLIASQFPSVNVSSSTTGIKDAKGPTVLVLTGVSSSVGAARTLAETVEQSFAQSAQKLVTELYEVKYAEVTGLSDIVRAAFPNVKIVAGPTEGFNLICPAAVAMGASLVGAASIDDKKSQAKLLLLQGNPSDIQAAKNLLAKMDVAQAQIMIEAKIVDISDSGADELGIEWGDKELGLTGTRFGENKVAGDDALSIGRFSRSAFQIDATLRGLITSGKGKILANPNVLAIDGKPASAFIGDEVTYVSGVTEGTAGVTFTTATAKTGVQLHTISRINSDGFITMNLHPEVSVITGWTTTSLGNELPQIARRYVDSTIRIKDGETIVIGGLIKDEEIKSISGVPFLKNLPVLGQFFKSKSSKSTHSEIMMFITPRVLTDSK